MSIIERVKNKPTDEKRTLNDWQPATYDLKDTWFALAHSRDVGAKPARRIIHRQRFFLWRDGHTLHAAKFHPEIRCNASTAEFTDGNGRYLVKERYGYIWGWYGNPENAHEDLLPQIPFLPRNGKVPEYMRHTVHFDCCMPLAVENLIDLTHADFLHAEVVGGDGFSESDEVTVEYTSETLTRTRMVTQKPVSPILRWVGGVRAKYQDFRSTLHVHLRSGLCISYPRFRPGFDIPNVQPFAPIGKTVSRIDQCFNLTNAPTPFRQIMPKMAFKIAPQDNYVVRPQNPLYLEPTDQRDLHSRFDAPGNRYRFLMQQLWKRQQKGDYSYRSDADPGGDVTALLGMNAPVD